MTGLPDSQVRDGVRDVAALEWGTVRGRGCDCAHEHVNARVRASVADGRLYTLDGGD